MKKTAMAMALLALTSGAQALVTYTGSDVDGFTSAADDFGAGRTVHYGREVYLDRAARVTFTAVFSEADYKSAFISIGDTEYSDVIGGGTYTADFEAGLLPFSFDVQTTGLSVANGGNQAAWESNSLQPWYGLSPIQSLPGEDFERFYVALNDDGNEFETDIDDYVIQVDVVETSVDVPEPGTAVLLGMGLMGIGLTRLKRRR